MSISFVKNSNFKRILSYVLCGAMLISSPAIASFAAGVVSSIGNSSEVGVYITTTPKMMVGDKINANISGVNDLYGLSTGYSIQWYRTSSGSTSDGVAIEGATGRTYTYTDEDLGNYVYALVSGEDENGEAFTLATNMTEKVVSECVAESENWITSADGLWQYDILDGTDNIQIKITQRSVKNEDVVVPSVIDGYTVTKLADGCFEAALERDSWGNADTYMSGLTLPETLEELGSNLYINSSLKLLVLPESVKYVAEDAFNLRGLYGANGGDVSYVRPVKKIVVKNPICHFDGILGEANSAVKDKEWLVGADGSSIHNMYKAEMYTYWNAGIATTGTSRYAFEQSGVYNAESNSVAMTADEVLQQKLYENATDWQLSEDGLLKYDVIDGTDKLLVTPVEVESGSKIEIPSSIEGIGDVGAVSVNTSGKSKVILDIPAGVIIDKSSSYVNSSTVISGNAGSNAEEYAKENNLIFNNKDNELTSKEEYDAAKKSSSFTSEDGYWEYWFIDGYNSVGIGNIKSFGKNAEVEVPAEIDGYKTSIFNGGMPDEYTTYTSIFLPENIIALGSRIVCVSSSYVDGYSYYAGAKNIIVYNKNCDLSVMDNVGQATYMIGYTGSTADLICKNRYDGTTNADGLLTKTVFIPLDGDISLESVVADGWHNVGSIVKAVISPSYFLNEKYQWMISDDDVTYAAIENATDETYTIKDEDLGKYIKVVVSGTSENFNGEVESESFLVSNELKTYEEYNAASKGEWITSEDGYWKYRVINGYNALEALNIQLYPDGSTVTPPESFLIDGVELPVKVVGSDIPSGTAMKYDNLILPENIAVLLQFRGFVNSSGMDWNENYYSPPKNVTVYNPNLDISKAFSNYGDGASINQPTTITGYTGSTADLICKNRYDGSTNNNGVLNKTVFIPLDEEISLENVSISGDVKEGSTLTAKVAPSIAYDLTYTWQVSDDNITFTEIEDANSATFKIPAGYAGKYVKISVAGNDIFSGNVEASTSQIAAGEAVKLNSVSIDNYSSSKKIGDVLTTTISPTGATATYQWYRDTSSSSSNSTGTIPATAEVIEGATESSYTLTAEDAGNYIFVVATGTGLNYGSVKSNSLSNVVSGNITNVTLINTDTSRNFVGYESYVGHTISAMPNTNDADSVYYQWYRDISNSSSNSTGKIPSTAEMISGATESTYTLTKEDFGKYVFVVIQGKTELGYGGIFKSVSNNGGNTIYSNITNVTLKNVDKKSSFLSSSESYVGQTIEATVTTNPSNMNDVSYQWYRSSSSFSSGGVGNNLNTYNNFDTNALKNAEAIEGATDSTYTLTKEDFGKYVFVVVTGEGDTIGKYRSASNNNSFPIYSNITNVTLKNVDTNRDFVSNSSYVGNTIEATVTTTPSNMNNVSYQWYRSSSNVGSAGVANSLSAYKNFDTNYLSTAEMISGATESTYTLTKEDFGKYVFVVVTGEGDTIGKYKSASNNGSYPIYSNITNVTITSSGSTSQSYVGDTLTATATTNPTTMNNVSYQWYRRSSSFSSTGVSSNLDLYNNFDTNYLKDAEAIEGATESTYTVTLEDVGYYLAVVATGEGDTIGKYINRLNNYQVLGKITSASINGYPYVGQTLTANYEPVEGTATYQWYYSSSATSLGSRISGATSKTYTVPADYKNYYIAVQVSGSGSYTSSQNAWTSAKIADLTNCEDAGLEHQAGDFITIKSPTCEEEGIEVQNCEVCGTELNRRSIEAIGHKYELVDGKYICTNTTEPEIINNSTYPWTQDKNGVWKSGNKGVSNSTSTLTIEFTLDKTTDISLDFMSNGENNYDYVTYTLKKDGTQVETSNYRGKATTYYTDLESVPESYWTTVNKTLDAGTYQMIFSYAKDSSGNSGLDAAYVRNINIPIVCGAEKPLTPLTDARMVGTLKVGKTLTAQVLPSDATVDWQWYSSADGSVWEEITGANINKLTLTESEQNKYIKVVATANGEFTGSKEVISSTLVKEAPKSFSSIDITGGEYVGDIQSVSILPSGATADIEWQRSDSEDGEFVTISTGSSYELSSEDVGKYVRAVINGTGDYEGSDYTSTPILVKEVVANINVSGVARVGKTLSVTVEPESINVSYGWQISDTKDGTYTTVGTKNSIKLLDEYGGKYIKVVGTGVDDTSLVLESDPVKVKKTIKSIGISGTPKAGNDLTLVIDPEDATGNVKWQISSSPDGEFTTVQEGTDRVYTVRNEDKGKWLQVIFEGTDDYEGITVRFSSGGSESGSSGSVTPGKGGSMGGSDTPDSEIENEWSMTGTSDGVVDDNIEDNGGSSSSGGSESGGSESGGSESGGNSSAGSVITIPDVPEGATGNFHWQYQNPSTGEWEDIPEEDINKDGSFTVTEKYKGVKIKGEFVGTTEEGEEIILGVGPIYIEDDSENSTSTKAGECNVYLSQAQTYSVVIPAFISMDGSKDAAENSATFYTVVTADIAGTDSITVKPETTSITLKEDGGVKKDLTATITADTNGWEYNFDKNDCSEDDFATGVQRTHFISVAGLSAGTWRGVFNWDISVSGEELKDSEEFVIYKSYDATGDTLDYISGSTKRVDADGTETPIADDAVINNDGSVN